MIDNRKTLLKKIAKNIRSFDLVALVRLLNRLGFPRSEIYFECHEALSSATSLCQSITFSNISPRVRIQLNLGLLGTNSPLPTFFQKYMEEEEINPKTFARFLGFFNHHLVQQFLEMTEPQHHFPFFTNWRETKCHYLSLLGFQSISTLWLLMKLIFPELVVNIKKNARLVRLDSSSLTLGRDGLGYESYIGERYEQTLSSFNVTFTTDDEVSVLGTPWPIEINKRLGSLLFPILKGTDLHLTLSLIIRKKFNCIHLGANSFLGFDRIGKNRKPFKLLLFHGFIRDFSLLPLTQ